MQPYVVRDGDFLLKIASKLGFDADTVWNDPSNADLRKLRPNPNILLAGDLLQVPEAGAPNATNLTPGTTNNFVAPTPPTMTITHKFVGADATAYASRPFAVEELDQLTGLTTDASGMATFDAPVTLETATIVFTDTGETWALGLGALNPLETLTGVFQRLQNLGYVGPGSFDGSLTPDNLEIVRAGLRVFRAASGASPPPSSPPSAPPSTPASTPTPSSPASTPAPSSPASAATPSSPASAPAPSSPASAAAPPSAAASAPAASPPSSTPVPSSPLSAPPSSSPESGASPPDSSPPSSSSPESAPPSSVPQDNAGLADDGTLDADTHALLLQAHGC